METRVKWWVVFVVVVAWLGVYAERGVRRIVKLEKGFQKVEFQLHYYLPDLPEECGVCHVLNREESRWKIKRTEK